MSQTKKVSIGIVSVIILVAIIYLFVPHHTNAPAASMTAQSTASQTYVASTTDTSDAALDQDMNAVGAQLNNINSSESDVDSSLNQTNQ